eukprot:1155141-Pelagomonas_calceolata.AAC.1
MANWFDSNTNKPWPSGPSRQTASHQRQETQQQQQPQPQQQYQGPRTKRQKVMHTYIDEKGPRTKRQKLMHTCINDKMKTKPCACALTTRQDIGGPRLHTFDERCGMAGCGTVSKSSCLPFLCSICCWACVAMSKPTRPPLFEP